MPTSQYRPGYPGLAKRRPENPPFPSLLSWEFLPGSTLRKLNFNFSTYDLRADTYSKPFATAHLEDGLPWKRTLDHKRHRPVIP